ncbi:MAG: hypothetical protein AABM40_11410 [Chloroflexota bacterium]
MVKVWTVCVALALAACAPSAVVTPSSPGSTPTSTTDIPKCSSARLTFLVDQFFARYNARDLDGFLALFNWESPAAGGGFGSYYDNPGQGQQLSDRTSLSNYVRGRWTLDDRFSVANVGPYPEGLAFPNANPTVEFTRSFSGVTQSGNAKLVCNAGLLVDVVMSSTQR